MPSSKTTVSGNIVDILDDRIYGGTIHIEKDRIKKITEDKKPKTKNFILPGFVDAHIHIESSMLPPSEFARIAAAHGTVAAVCDPHEIANVLGMQGIKYMLENAEKTPFKFFFGAPSCVPASPHETSGAKIGTLEIEKLLKRKDILFLAEVMDYPGVIHCDLDVWGKIILARKAGKPIDGHAPGLTGEELKKYAAAKITTDHECTTKKEATEKLGYGIQILIREGSAAKNFDELCPLLEKHSLDCMFCSDDKHPNDLIKGHINELVKRAVAKGIKPIKALQAACVNPVLHYGLDVGLLCRGDYADFIVVDNLTEFNVLETWVNGRIIARKNEILLPKNKSARINKFNAQKINPQDLAAPMKSGKIQVIEAQDKQLSTNKIPSEPKKLFGYAVSDTENDILKIVVINRYKKTKPSVAFTKGFGLKEGAIASSVAHDSHNIISVGASDEDICRAVNLIIENKGGISAVCAQKEKILSLPIAGLMSDLDYKKTSEKYTELDKMAKSIGSKLSAPYMTLSFMALLVIPALKIGDKGLFDSENFRFTNLFIES